MFPILRETRPDAAQLEALLDRCFGDERKQKTVYRLREGVMPLAELSFAVRDGSKLVGSLRFWPIVIAGRHPAIMLGPLAVDPDRQGEGIGRALVRHGLYSATRLGHRLCLLVGDPPYYEPFGFRPATPLGLELPGWVQPERFQAMELVPGALEGVRGMVGKPAVSGPRAARPAPARRAAAPARRARA